MVAIQKIAMKESLKVLLAVAVFTLVMLTLGFIVGRHYPAEDERVTDTVTDTVTDWQYDTVFRVDTRVVKLPIHDTTTVTDSLWVTDSVLVEVPISRYRYDTILKDTHSTTRLTASLSGYEVRVDTLAVTTTIEPIIIKETLPWRKRIRPSVGVGIGTNLKGEATAGVFVGIGYLW